MKMTQALQQSRAQGRMLFSAVGAIWMLYWCSKTQPHDPGTVLLILLSGAAMFLWALCDFRSAGLTKERAPYKTLPASGLNASGGFEFVLCAAMMGFSLVLALNLLGHPEWLAPALMLVASLLCLPMAELHAYRAHHVTAFALLLLSLAYPFLDNHGLAQTLACFAAGAIFWISALYGFFQEHYPMHRPLAAGRPPLVLLIP